MIKLIIGKKGSGKTKKLVDMVNAATEQSLGNVVCIEKGDTLTYSVTHKARLIDAESYGISGYGEYYGMVAGIKAGNNDVTHIFGDATLRIGERDCFIDKLLVRLVPKVGVIFSFYGNHRHKNLIIRIGEF